MRPLLLLVNDDGYAAPGMKALMETLRPLGDLLVFAPDGNRSGKAHSMTSDVPLFARLIEQEEGCTVYACNGMPVDCVKLALARFVPRRPSLVASGINRGSNASVCALYSGTVGAAMEAAQGGLAAVAFSLATEERQADFSPTLPLVRSIAEETLLHGLPPQVMLNVNFPDTGRIRGARVCRSAAASWSDEAMERKDPFGRTYYWLNGQFHCDDWATDADQWCLQHGYASITPCRPDYTDRDALSLMRERYETRASEGTKA